MIGFIVFYLLAMTVYLLHLMLKQYRRGTHELLSMRNFLLIGFIIFQLTGAVGSVVAGGTGVFVLQSPVATSIMYCCMATVFVVILLWTYERGFAIPSLAALTPTTRALPGDAALFGIALILIGLSGLLRLGVAIPLVYYVTAVAGTTMAVAACGISGWLWGRRFYNPLAIAVVAGICTSAVFITTTGAFGRRGLVAIGAALLWGLYYSSFRYHSTRTAISRLALVSVVPIIAVALFTSARDAAEHDRTAMEHLQAIRSNADLMTGLGLLAQGQDAATNSLWLIEQFPGDFETRPLFTPFYLLVYPVPREWWPNKPLPLSTLLPHMGQVHNVDRDRLTLGPGIIGHAAAEGGWIALIIYAILLGLFIRYLDELIAQNVWSPLVILALGSSFGQVIGITRGETSAFIALFLIGIVNTYIVMLVIGKLLEAVSGTPMQYMPEESEQWEAEDVAHAPLEGDLAAGR